MSVKYDRIKQADLSLPAPLRWLTRAFSSITLAVILLTLVALYGIAATIPVFFFVLAGAYLLVGLPTLGAAGMASFITLRRLAGARWPVWLLACAGLLSLLGAAGYTCYLLCVSAYAQLSALPWMQAHRATVVYRLPWLEMTELEFYGWWPMQVILILFVLNMVWSTIRRIEFKFVNLGVLTVHAGIVVLALGSILYGHFKVEGDTILWRRDLGGPFERVFYDSHEPALYLDLDDRQLMVPLPELPRYNDYPLGSLDIALHERPAMRELLGPDVRVSIPGFHPYGELEPRWRPIRDRDDLAAAVATSPALHVALGTSDGPTGQVQATLAAEVPGARVLERPGYTVEYLLNPSQQRIEDLRTGVDGSHGLIIEIPEQGFRAAYSVEVGQTIELEELGYRFTVQDLGDYGMPFVTEGYENATDTRAVVAVTTPDGEQFARLAMHRYPERSQDFVPSDDPAVGPMGERRDPDPSVRIVYLDNTRSHYHLIADEPDADVLSVIVRLPGLQEGMWAGVPDQKLPLPSSPDGLDWLYLDRIIPLAGRMIEPAPVPKAQRDPKDEGTYVRSLLPVRLEVDRPAEEGGTWSRVVWMRHMRYPKYPDEVHRPVFVDVPGVGQVRLAFSRRQFELPFAVGLEHFEMTPVPGSEIPQDFTADLLLADLGAEGVMFQQPERHRVHMNHPLNYRTSASAPLALRRVKISQTGWDPGDAQDPNAEVRDEQGRFINQQRFTILGIGNNVGIRIIAIGAIMVVAGIPWAFYIKPLLVQRQKRKIQRELTEQGPHHPEPPTSGADGDGHPAPPALPVRPLPHEQPRSPTPAQPSAV